MRVRLQRVTRCVRPVTAVRPLLRGGALDHRQGGRCACVVPLVLPVELPYPDVVVVCPLAGRVMMFVDPRVTCAVAADAVVRVKGALRASGDRRHNISLALGVQPRALG